MIILRWTTGQECRSAGAADEFGANLQSRPMELRVTESTAALVRERVKVATSRFQETRVYKTRDYVEDPLPGLRIVAHA